LLTGAGLYTPSPKTTASWTKLDSLALILILILFAPVYLYSIYELPLQINTDEITIMLFQSELASNPGVDWLGSSSYFGFPAFIFVVLGKIGHLLGGIDLFHMRALHAVSGLAIVGVGFSFFRQIMPRWWAVCAAAILGANHSLVMISRMAMRDNTGLLFELLAFSLLWKGFSSSSRFYSFLGGTAAGLTFYTYYPSRITIVIWAVFVLAWHQFKSGNRKNPPKSQPHNLLSLGLITALSFALVSAPIVVSTLAQPPSTQHYARQQVMLFPEGRQLQQYWLNAPSPAAAWKQNLISGLTTFNNRLHDQGYIYPNYGHGFVDPLTGLLLWLGLLIILIRLARQSPKKPAELFVVIGFAGLWLLSSVILTKAPNYTRLLVILPFTSYLCTVAIRYLASLARWLPGKMLHLKQALIAVSAVSVIVLFNLGIAQDFIAQGQTSGDSVGNTARYTESYASRQGHNFYLAANDQYPYYSWGQPSQWQDWLGFFTSPGQTAGIVDPSQSLAGLDRPFTLFMNKLLWTDSKAQLTQAYPDLRLEKVTPDSRLLAVEVP
jgi:4-amino-4-deoxy-L-arabinose transferase-like glycosyltransferase